MEQSDPSFFSPFPPFESNFSRPRNGRVPKREVGAEQKERRLPSERETTTDHRPEERGGSRQKAGTTQHRTYKRLFRDRTGA